MNDRKRQRDKAQHMIETKRKIRASNDLDAAIRRVKDAFAEIGIQVAKAINSVLHDLAPLVNELKERWGNEVSRL